MSNLDFAELLADKERLETDGSTSNFLENFVKMPEGNGLVILRLLPPAKAGMFNRAKNRLYCSTRIHRVNNHSLHCPKKLVDGKWKGDCDICRYYQWLWNESENKSPAEADALQTKARAIKPIERYYYNALVRSVMNEKTQQLEKNVGPKIFSVGKTVHKMIVRAIVGDETMHEEPLGDVTDVKHGRDFKLVKVMRQSGKMSYPNYSDSKFEAPSPLGDDAQIAKWLAALHDLEGLVVIKSPEELKRELKIHLGLIPADPASGGSNFDPTEFQKSEGVENVATVVTQETPRVEARTTTTVLGDEDKSLADDEFLSQLKSMT